LGRFRAQNGIPVAFAESSLKLALRQNAAGTPLFERKSPKTSLRSAFGAISLKKGFAAPAKIGKMLAKLAF